MLSLNFHICAWMKGREGPRIDTQHRIITADGNINQHRSHLFLGLKKHLGWELKYVHKLKAVQVPSFSRLCLCLHDEKTWFKNRWSNSLPRGQQNLSTFQGFWLTCSRQSNVPWYSAPPLWFIMRVRTTSTGFDARAPAKPHTKLDLLTIRVNALCPLAMLLVLKTVFMVVCTPPVQTENILSLVQVPTWHLLL